MRRQNEAAKLMQEESIIVILIDWLVKPVEVSSNSVHPAEWFEILAE
jgi:hypothetical protein